MNVVGVPGRLVCGLVADRLLGPVNTLIPVAFCAGLVLYSWAAVTTTSGIYVFCAMYGFFGAAIQSLFPTACTTLTSDLSKIGTRTGMTFCMVSIACLTGAPIAGALIQLQDGSYLYAQAFGGSTLLGGTLLLMSARFAKTGLHLHTKM